MHTKCVPSIGGIEKDIEMNDRKHGAGKHDFPRVLEECGIDPRILHDEVYGVDDWVDRVVEFAESDISKKYRRHTSNDLKGAAFEHLVQCVIEFLGQSIEVNCIDVHATKAGKTGIDLIGRTLDEKPHLHQCKFINDPAKNLSWNIVSDFVGACPAFAEGAGYSMTLWTTGRGITQNAQEAAPSLKVFGIDWLGDTLGSSEDFWYEVYGRSLKATPKSKVGRIFKEHKDTIKPHGYQQAALDTFISEVKAQDTFKGRYIYPTGAGKTLIESLILNHQIDRCSGGVHLVVAPRIALLIQLMGEYREFIGDRYLPIGLHSGSEEPESDDSDWMRRTQRNTTDPCVVDTAIQYAKSKGKSAVVFSTYHSLYKLTPKFGHKLTPKLDFSFDTMIADESQYCVSENYFEQIKDIDAKIKLYFTATERHYAKKDGTKAERSNDNEEVFGKPLGSETVKDLVKRGILVEPILHLMLGETMFEQEEKDRTSNEEKHKVDQETLIAEAQHIAKEQRRMVHKDMHAKTLFACRKAENVEIIVDLKNNRENLHKLQRKVPDHTIFTIISKKPFGAMIDGGPVNRKTFLERLASCDGNALVFHYNILSEGIDVDGITGVALLRKMGDAKLMQTIGRCLRPYKKDPSLKPHAYLSVPIIEGSLHKNENLNDIVRKILESGLDIDSEKLVISDGRSTPRPKPKGPKGKTGSKHDRGTPKQIELDIYENELKTIIDATEEKMAEDYRLGMLDREITTELIDGMLDGRYPSQEFAHGEDALKSAQKICEVALESCRNRHYVVEKAWARNRMFESEVDASGSPKVRPITPLHLIKEHVDRLGDISGKLTLTFNVEYIPYLTEKKADVVLATRNLCQATRNLAESQAINTRYVTMEDVLGDSLKFDIVIGNPPYQERKLEHTKSQAIWNEFVEDAHRILKEGGKLAMIHPAGWRNLGGGVPQHSDFTAVYGHGMVINSQSESRSGKFQRRIQIRHVCRNQELHAGPSHRYCCRRWKRIPRVHQEDGLHSEFSVRSFQEIACSK